MASYVIKDGKEKLVQATQPADSKPAAKTSKKTANSKAVEPSKGIG